MNNQAKKMKKALLFATILLATIAVFRSPSAAITADEAEATFKAKCAICHGMDGSGNTVTGKKLNAKDLRRDEIRKMSDSQLYQIIGYGKNKMPGYEQTLGKEKVNQLINYTRGLGKKD